MSKNDYQRYLELGGIINENDYNDILSRAESITSLNKTLVKQVQIIAKFTGIKLRDPEVTVDEKIVLYVILRSDVRPEKVRHHHSQMCDQRLLAEALRMLGDIDALNKLIHAHPHISFVHEQREVK